MQTEKKCMLDNWQRIEQIIKWAGFASVSAFAREIGLNRSENLYQIKRGNNGISKDLADTIVSRFPDVSKAWLLTGEGSMLRGDNRYRSFDVPFYKADAIQVVTAGDVPEPSCYISFPVFENCDFAAFSMTDAMEPEIPRGTILFFRKVAPQTFVPGETYLVISAEFNGVRTIRRDPKGDELRLVARNKAAFDEVIIPADSIEKLYMVRGIVIGKGC